jgi:hypothetical protein
MDIIYLEVGVIQFLSPETNGWLNGWGSEHRDLPANSDEMQGAIYVLWIAL